MSRKKKKILNKSKKKQRVKRNTAVKKSSSGSNIISINRTYQNNLLFLKGSRPKLYQALIGLHDNQNYRIIKTENNLPNLNISTKSGSFLLHSQKDPLNEARTDIDKVSLSNTNCVILLGFGLGYYAVELLKRISPDCFFLIIEQDINIFKAALSSLDLREIIEKQNVDFMVGEHVSEIIPKLVNRFSEQQSNNVQVVAHSQSTKLYAEYQQIVEGIVKSTKIVQSNTETRLQYGLKWYENSFKNITSQKKLSGIKGLFNKFNDIPAIIISSGPSLDKNIQYLKSIKNEKVLLIAVDTALKCLLSHNIKPDFVTSIDCQEITSSFFTGIALDDIYLISPFRIPHSVIEKFHGRAFFCDDKELNFWKEFRKYLEGLGDVNIGGTVAIFTFDLIRKFGCDPIVFLGQDLSFGQGRYYARGTYKDEVRLENTDSSADLRQDELMNHTNISEVNNIFGHPIKTSGTMLNWLTWFEVEIRKTKANCINASEEGIFQKDITISPLKEVLFQHVKKDKRDGKSLVREFIENNPSTSTENLNIDLIPVRNKLNMIVQTCEKITEKCSIYAEKFLTQNHHDLGRIHGEIKELCDRLVKEDEFSSHFRLIYLIFKRMFSKGFEKKIQENPDMKYILVVELEAKAILETGKFIQSFISNNSNIYQEATAV